jgi:hypothetical protein
VQSTIRYNTRTAVRDKVFANPGNRYLEFIDVSGVMVRIPNVIRDFDTSYEDAPAPSADTVIIARQGRTYAVGAVAKRMKGRSAFDKGKLALLGDSIFAALEAIPHQSVLRVEELMIAVPDVRNPDAIAAGKALEGTHEYTRNGQSIIGTVAKVVLIEEATAAYNYALANHLFQWPDSINGVIDFGGGTSSGRLYDQEGLVLRDAALILPGTNALAQAIQARLLKELGASPELSLIMDGIESGTYQLGRNGANFTTHFTVCRDQWLDDIRSRAVSQWTPYKDDIGEVILVGGSANLAQSLEVRTAGRFKIADNPQDVTILGMVI